MPAYKKRILPSHLKRAIKERDGYRCTRPGCPGWEESSPILHIHHVLPKKYGGSDEMSNLITLCLPHHKAVHADFYAYYPDARPALQRMWLHMRGMLTKIGAGIKYGTFYDYKTPLEYLTGHRSFRGGQDEVFEAVMKGRDVLFVAPTGVGKSVTYQLPGLLRQNSTLVISPLKALMKNQVEKLLEKYIPATYVNGDVGTRDRANRINFITRGMMKFVYVAPERYFKSRNSAPIFAAKYDLFVVDEAHCIDKWGSHFRQDYGELGTMRKGLGSPQTIAVTASASIKTQNEIIRSLDLQNPKVIVKGFFRANIYVHVYKGNKAKNLKQALEGYIPTSGRTIFYVASVKEGLILQEQLRDMGMNVFFLPWSIARRRKGQYSESIRWYEE